MEPAAHLQALEEAAGTLLATAAGSTDRPVPSCPGWTVCDLVVHVGLVWEWAAAIVERGERAERGEGPVDRSENALFEWADERAERVLVALRAADPDSGCWTFGLPRTRRFWIRRQALETTLHAWDAVRATGATGSLDGEVAADGVDEFVTVMVPRHLARDHGTWAGESLHLHRTDGGGEWLVRLGPDGRAEAERAHAKGDVALRGTGEALWLWCTNRGAPDALGIEVLGDAGVAAHWTSHIVF